MTCPKCANRGLITVQYRDGSPFDLAACDCPAGQVFRKPGMLRLWCEQRGVTPGQIGRLEEFEDADNS